MAFKMLDMGQRGDILQVGALGIAIGLLAERIIAGNTMGNIYATDGRPAQPMDSTDIACAVGLVGCGIYAWMVIRKY